MRTIATVTLSLSFVALAACSKPAPKEYAYPAWNFAATFTGEPKVTETKASGPQPASFLAVGSSAGRDYSIYVMDASGATVGPNQLLENAAQALASSQDIDLGPNTPVTTDGVAGRQVLFNKNDKPAALVRFFLAGGKLYEVNATVPAGAADPTARAFLDSFRLLTPPVAAAPAANAATNAAAPATNGA
ncbi:MAG TPA: hypothetical protein VMU37_05420 [Caulobacteraceae bacterium]|nr:hypothetical protein [Caulobacteraceae bacterium]